MTKKIKIVLDLLDYWKPKLSLGDWEITVKRVGDDHEENLLAQCLPSFNYREATLTVFPAFYKETPREQKSTILHELLHIILDPYNEIFRDMREGKIVTRKNEININEQTTSWLEKIIMNL